MVKERNIAVSIIFAIITCGLYNCYWFISLTDDLNTLAGEDDTSGVEAFVFTIITCGIYGIYWAFRMGEKIDAAKQRRGISSSNSGVLYLILYMVSCGVISNAVIQYEINRMLELPRY